jgi:glycosyltransferase involved in cell wall biosynthesis
MTVGFLHNGTYDHGVVRYGRVLARGAREHLDDEVVEATVDVSDPRGLRPRHVRPAAERLAGADVVHVQYNARVWGSPRHAPRTVRAFFGACPAPVVATVHDARDGYGVADLLRRLWAQRSSGGPGGAGGDEEAGTAGLADALRGLAASARKAVSFLVREAGNALATRALARRAARVLVCTREEHRRLAGLVPAARLGVVPHFVEDRAPPADREAARETLGLAGRRVVSVLGYIHQGKGHDRVVEALPHLPADVVAVFVGRPGLESPEYGEALEARAEALGVADRLRITGYVPDERLDQYLAATDVAVCPFREAAASGSLSTWIAAERPLVASDLPLFREYNDLAPGAIATVDAGSPSALGAALKAALAGEARTDPDALRRLHRTLSVPAIAEQHRTVYRSAKGEGRSAK